MKKLYLHIGLHKTGTSAIQSFLCQNRTSLSEKGFYYPDTGKFEAHHSIAAFLRKEASDGNNKLILKDKFLSLTGDNDVSIISSEIFSECGDISSLSVLPEIYDDITVVVYVRRQDKLLESAYGQQVKQNFESRKIVEYDPYFFDIYKHLKKFRDVIPNANFLIRNYDGESLYEGNSAKDFLVNVLNLDVSDFLFLDEKVNKSLSSVGLELLRRLNKYNIADSKEAVGDIIKVSENLGGDFNRSIVGGLYSPQQRIALAGLCAESNVKMKDEFNFEIPVIENGTENLPPTVGQVLEMAILLLSEKYK